MARKIRVNPTAVEQVVKNEMARQIGVDNTTLNKVLNNQRAYVSWEMLGHLFRYFRDPVTGEPYPLPGFLEWEE